MFVFVEVQVAASFFVFGAEDSVGRGELGHDKAAASEIADEAAEDGVGYSGHGGENGGGTDLDAADSQRGRNAGNIRG